MRNLSAQKGFSPILIIVLVVVGFVLVYGASVVLRSNANKSGGVVTEDVSEPRQPLFKTHETDKYVFKYPSYFVPFTADYVEGTEIAYHDPKSDRTEPAFMYMYTIKDPKMVAGQAIVNYRDLKECQELFEAQKDSTETKVIRIEVTSDKTSDGCFFMSSTPVPNTSDAVVVVQKTLNPLVSQQGILAYRVTGAFFESDRKEVKELIELAVQNFELK